MNYYFERYWDEPTADPQTGTWGTSTYYFETDEGGKALRQIEVFQNGQKLSYNLTRNEDEFGKLSEVALDLNEFGAFNISKKEFEDKWKT